MSHLQHSSEYPALTSALNLLDEIFDLQARSQWLRRGLINRLLGTYTTIHIISILITENIVFNSQALHG